MTTPSGRQRLLPSVLDRLLEDGGPWTVESEKRVLRRDLEWLLNTRRVVAGLPTGPGPLGKSAVTYGLPDLASFRAGSAGDRERLRLAVREAIRRFEPRLSRVRVTLESGPAPELPVRLRIDALLRVEPEPEPVAFGSVLRLDDQSFEVRDLTP
jgi:type VI secretion system protein ImpF